MKTQVACIDAQPRFFARNRLRTFLVRHRYDDPARTLRFLYGIDVRGLTPPDIVIGAGRPTAAAGVLIRRLSGARFVHVGALRDHDAGDIDLMLVGSPRQAGPGRVFCPVPTLIDPTGLPPPRSLAVAGDLRDARISLFLGGDGPCGYRYTGADWRRLEALVRDTAPALGIRWQVANSRRTPRAASLLFAALAHERIIERFVDFTRAGEGSIDPLYAADAIVVTEDSLSMIAEALAARRPVVAVRPAASGRHGFGEEIVAMAGRGGLAILPIAALDAASLTEIVIATVPSPTDPRDLIAAALAPLLGSGKGRPADEPL